MVQFRIVASLLLALTLLSLSGSTAAAGELKVVQTPYYVMHTDLPPEAVREASLRMSRMAEEYYERTKEFSGRVSQRLPFYLFAEAEDYYRAGGAPGSAGVYMRRGNDKKLMAIAGREVSATTWHVIQHEGFHQFADATIGELPAWVNEGLAEYFGEAVWTGDAFVAGIVPAGRLKRIQEGIQAKTFRPLPLMMRLTLQEWNMNLSIDNYDQAWAMCHFLAHANEGKYQKAFVAFVRGVNRRVPWQDAWQQAFGSVDGFEKVWAEWWLNQQPGATADLETRATLLTLASFAGRASAMKQLPAELPGLVKAIQSGELAFDKELWLPPSLFERAAAGLKQDEANFSLLPAEKGQPARLLAERPDGTRLVATLPTRATVPLKISLEIDDLAPAIVRAEALANEGKKKDASKVLSDAIRRNPKSPSLEQARKLVGEWR